MMTEEPVRSDSFVFFHLENFTALFDLIPYKKPRHSRRGFLYVSERTVIPSGS